MRNVWPSHCSSKLFSSFSPNFAQPKGDPIKCNSICSHRGVKCLMFCMQHNLCVCVCWVCTKCTGQVQESRCTNTHKRRKEICAAALCQPDNLIVVLWTQSDIFTLSPLVQLCPTGLSTKLQMFEVLAGSRREEDNHIFTHIYTLPLLFAITPRRGRQTEVKR